MNATKPALPARAPRLVSILTIGITTAVLTATLLQLALVDHFGSRYASDEAGIRLQQLSWQMRDMLDGVISGAAADARLLAELPTLRDARDPTQTRQVLDSLQRNVPDYAWIGLAGADGKVIAATGGMLEGEDVRARPWFATGLRGGGAEDYHPAALLNKLLPKREEPWRFVDVAVPVVPSDGGPTRVLGVHLSWEWARRQVRQLLVPAFRQYGAEVLVVRNDGTVILGPKSLEEKKIATRSVERAMRGETGAVVERWPDGETYVTGFSRSGDPANPMSLQWTVLVRQPQATAQAGAQALVWRILWQGSALAFLLAMAAIVLTRRLTAPINRILDVIERRANGEASQPAELEQGGVREVQVLSQAVRELIAYDERHVAALRAMNEQLEQTVAERTAELRDMALRDALTGLPNRRALMDTLAEAIQRCDRLGQHCAVLFLDLDGFKGVNDTYGHEEGDELLRQFAARLAGAVRKTDTVARLAGDEFVVLLELLEHTGAIADTADKIMEVLQPPYMLKTTTLSLSSSIGVASYLPGSGEHLDALLARADAAMYKAKRSGKNRVVLAGA